MFVNLHSKDSNGLNKLITAQNLVILPLAPDSHPIIQRSNGAG